MLTIHNVAYHHNGSRTTPSWVVRFDLVEGDHTYNLIATVSDTSTSRSEGLITVLEINALHRGEIHYEWCGDDFVDSIWSAIEDYRHRTIEKMVSENWNEVMDSFDLAGECL